MRKYFWWIICAFMVIGSASIISWMPVSATKVSTTPTAAVNGAASAKEMFGQYVSGIYNTAQLDKTGMDMAVFQKAITGFINLKLAGKVPQNSNIITVVDFNKPSHEKRMWIVDLLNKTLLLNTWVAHGQGTGDDMAKAFSNTEESHQSSLGFYVTDDVYFGKHGRSLKLNGMDAGFNDKALERSIVVHAADYVCQNTINQLGRLGRSFGCPAVSPEVSDMVINTIKGKTMLFISGNDSRYTSKYMDENVAEQTMYPDSAAATNTIAKL